MSEPIKVQVPLEGANVNSGPTQPAAEKPQWARKSLHAVRMPRQEVQLEPQWVTNGPNTELRWRPVEPGPAAQDQPYQPQETYAENQHGNDQPLNDPTLEHVRQFNAQPGPARPDPAGYDMYDPADVAAYQQANDAYMQSVIDQRVQAALQPHMEDLTTAKWERDYNSTSSRYGSDPNFSAVMEIALQRVVDEQGKISILQAYQEADNKDRARPGVRGNAHLPEAFRDKKRGIGMLGRIMHHNQQTGRSRPFGGRNWKG